MLKQHFSQLILRRSVPYYYKINYVQPFTVNKLFCRNFTTDTKKPNKWAFKAKENVVTPNNVNFDITNFEAKIKRVIYHNEDNGYTVAIISPSEQIDKEVNIVGNFIDPGEGEFIKISGGSWVQRGEEFQIQTKQILPANPSARKDIEIYLAKMFKGIGRQRAKLIVEMFGSKVFEVIENNPAALLKVPGLGPKKLEIILKPYLEKVSARELFDFLISHGNHYYLIFFSKVIWEKFSFLRFFFVNTLALFI